MCAAQRALPTATPTPRAALRPASTVRTALTPTLRRVPRRSHRARVRNSCCHAVGPECGQGTDRAARLVQGGAGRNGTPRTFFGGSVVLSLPNRLCHRRWPALHRYVPAPGDAPCPAQPVGPETKRVRGCANVLVERSNDSTDICPAVLACAAGTYANALTGATTCVGTSSTHRTAHGANPGPRADLT